MNVHVLVTTDDEGNADIIGTYSSITKAEEALIEYVTTYGVFNEIYLETHEVDNGCVDRVLKVN